MVRRFLLTALCLFGLGVVVLLVLSSRKRSVARVHEPGRTRRSEPAEPRPSVEVAAMVRPAAAKTTARSVEQDATRILQAMAETRADIIAGVSRRPLFLMAKERGVSCGLFVASKWDLLDAILEAEGLSPDRQASSASAQRRLKELAAEAYRREAEETEQRESEQSPTPAHPRSHLPWRRFKTA